MKEKYDYHKGEQLRVEMNNAVNGEKHREMEQKVLESLQWNDEAERMLSTKLVVLSFQRPGALRGMKISEVESRSYEENSIAVRVKEHKSRKEGPAKFSFR